MKKVTLQVQETLKYTREIEIEIPDEMTEEELQEHLNLMEKDEYLADAVYVLKDEGITVLQYDDDLSSPDSGEVEVTDFEFKD